VSFRRIRDISSLRCLGDKMSMQSAPRIAKKIRAPDSTSRKRQLPPGAPSVPVAQRTEGCLFALAHGEFRAWKRAIRTAPHAAPVNEEPPGPAPRPDFFDMDNCGPSAVLDLFFHSHSLVNQ
jgi:hypothetical protein